jgi:NhaA family Na+:H+ antiporter
MQQEAAAGIVMLTGAIVALLWANSPWHEGYARLWETDISVSVGELLHLDDLTLRDWVNDAAMAIFFFVIGLEIKREIAVGSLRHPRAIAAPALAALGGMIVPAAIFLAFNRGGPGGSGWGIPMATDIAFAVGIVSLLGRRVPPAAKVFLLTLAVVDDIGAILVIAVFYTTSLSVPWLLSAIAGLGVIALMNKRDVRSSVPYVVTGVFVWLSLLESGVHATLAGVAIGLMTPSWSFFDPRAFAGNARPLVDAVDRHMRDGALTPGSMDRVQASLRDLMRLASESVSPLDRITHRLHLWSGFVVVPVFALANAGVRLSGDAFGGIFTNRVTIGVFLGLLIGKVTGITGTTWLAVRSGLGALPEGSTWRQMVGIGIVGGVGFTVALFVTTLGLGPGLRDNAKIGIFASSVIAGSVGYLWLRWGAKHDGPAPADAGAG